jgi:hypothetical protein
MKNLNKTKIVKIAALTASVSAIVVSLGFGCGLGFEPVGGVTEVIDLGSNGGGGGGLVLNSADGINVIQGTRTFSVPVYTAFYNSTLSKMELNPAVQAETTSSRAEFTRQRGSLSDDGKPTSISAPFAFASTALSAAACDDRLRLEQAVANAARRIYFNDINLAAASANNVTDANVSLVINRLARGLWRRNETAEERTFLLDFVRQNLALDLTADSAAKTRRAALSLCTLMASSTSGIDN